MDKGRVGDIVWYIVGTTRQKAKITAISGSTHATIRLLTGPEAGRELEAPWGIIEPCTEHSEKPGDDAKKKVLEILEKYGLHESYTNEGLDGLTLVHYSNGKPTKSRALGLSIYWYGDGGWDYDRGHADKTQLDTLTKLTAEILAVKSEWRHRQRNFPPEPSSS